MALKNYLVQKLANERFAFADNLRAAGSVHQNLEEAKMWSDL